MSLTIASWNVNSIRSRQMHVLEWLAANPVDFLGVQETKVMNENFPHEVYTEVGYTAHIHGQKSYNGVCWLTPHEVESVTTGFGGVDVREQARVITTEYEGITLINMYAPQGENVDSPKFEFKREFYRTLLEYLEEYHDPSEPLVLVGDFNIAPAAADLDDVERRAGKCMFTQEEHSWLQGLHDWGLVDALRVIDDRPGLFSWWDYRSFAWERGGGMRIDLIMVTQPLVTRIERVWIDQKERGREKPSDHAPVILSLSE